MTKAWVSDACRRISLTGQQIHGAIAFCEEHDIRSTSSGPRSRAHLRRRRLPLQPSGERTGAVDGDSSISGGAT